MAEGGLSIVASLERVFGLLTRPMKAKVFALFVLMILAAVLELLSISLLLPLLQLVIAPDAMANLGLTPALRYIPAAFRGDVTTLAIVLLAVFLFKNVLVGGTSYIQARVLAGLQKFMIVKLVQTHMNRPYEKHIDVSTAHAIHDISTTAPGVVTGILRPFLSLIMEVLLSVGAVSALFFITALGATTVTAVLAIGLIAFYFVLRGTMYRLGRRRLSNNQDLVTWGLSALNSVKEAKVLRVGQYFVNGIADAASRTARVNSLLDLISQLPRIYGELLIVLALALAIPAIVAENQSITLALPVLGVFTAAGMRVLPSANRVVHHLGALKEASVHLEQVYERLREACVGPQDPLGRGAIVTLKNEIVLKQVSYRYPRAPTWALRGLDLTIHRGTSLALAGATGAGKSTLADILLGLLQPTEGSLTVDGTDVSKTLEFWRKSVGYVPQNIHLLDSTVRRNVAFGVPDEKIEDDLVWRALRAAHLEDFVAKLQDRLDCRIGENGIRFSGGQRQRLAIARALYRDPDFIVLDEATSALDTETEAEITKALEELSREKTLIVIAHRLSTIRHCDQVAMFDNGRLLDVGKFDELLGRCAEFRRMVELGDFTPRGALASSVESPEDLAGASKVL